MRQNAPPPSQQPRQQTPVQQAVEVYNDGVRLVKKADKAQEAAGAASDAGKKDKQTKEAQDKYTAASPSSSRRCRSIPRRTRRGTSWVIRIASSGTTARHWPPTTRR